MRRASAALLLLLAAGPGLAAAARRGLLQARSGRTDAAAAPTFINNVAALRAAVPLADAPVSRNSRPLPSATTPGGGGVRQPNETVPDNASLQANNGNSLLANTSAAANSSIPLANGSLGSDSSSPVTSNTTSNTTPLQASASGVAIVSPTANATAPGNASILPATNASETVNATLPANASQPANTSLPANASLPANVSKPANATNTGGGGGGAAAAPSVPSRPLSTVAVPPSGVCDVSSGQILGRQQESTCFFLVGDPEAAGRLLYGTNASAPDAFLAPPPLKLAAASPGRVPLFGGAGAAVAGGPALPNGGGAAADTLWTTSELFSDVAVNSSFLVLANVAGAAEPAVLRRPPGDPISNPHAAKPVPGAGGAAVLLTYRGAGPRGGGLAALNLRTGAAQDLLPAAGAGGLGRGFNSPRGLEAVPVPSAYVEGADPASNSTFAVALFTDPSTSFDLGNRTGPRAQGNAVWAVTLRLPRPGTAFDDPSAPWAPVLVSPPRIVADGFVRPGDVAVSPDRETAYVIDSGRVNGGGASVGPSPPLLDASDSMPPARVWMDRPSSISAFLLAFVPGRVPTAVLLSRRTLATPSAVGTFDAIKTDACGTVWASENQGISALDPASGRLLLQVRTANVSGPFALVPAAAAAAGGGSGASEQQGSGANGTLAFSVGQARFLATVTLPGLRPIDPDAWLLPPDHGDSWGGPAACGGGDKGHHGKGNGHDIDREQKSSEPEPEFTEDPSSFDESMSN
jgi:hypothetical protein